MRGALLVEFLVLFCLVPAGLALWPLPGWPFPILWTATIYCFVVLWRKPDFRTRELWRAAAVPRQWRSILAFFLPVAAVISATVYFVAPRVFLNLPRRQPFGWALVMLLYPLLSVVPQTLVYRAFIFARYRILFPSVSGMLFASAVSFSWVHIVLRNPVAPLLTLPAGVLFAWRYKRTGSVMASALEHALYGCLIFTIGLGGYFYTGAVR